MRNISSSGPRYFSIDSGATNIVNFSQDPSESAIIATLPPGNYTAIVRGVNNTTGVALAEVYDLH